MTALAAQPLAAEASLLMVLLWSVAASLIPFLRLRWRAGALWVIVLLGVPTLGWLTFVCGPGAGVLAFGLGMVVLIWQPVAAMKRRRAAQARRHSGPAI